MKTNQTSVYNHEIQFFSMNCTTGPDIFSSYKVFSGYFVVLQLDKISLLKEKIDLKVPQILFEIIFLLLSNLKNQPLYMNLQNALRDEKTSFF